MKRNSSQIATAFLGGGCDIASLWVQPILIRPRLAIQRHKDKENDTANEGNQSNEYPPSTAPSVVEPADCQSDTRNQDHQRIETLEQSNTPLRAEGPNQDVDKNQHEGDDKVAEEEHPVFFSPRPPAEHCVLFQYFKIPAHDRLHCCCPLLIR